MTLGRLVSATLAVLLSSACGSSMGNTAGGGSGAGGGGTDGGGGGGSGDGGGGSGDDGGTAQDGGSPGGFAIELHPTNAQGCEGIMPSSAPVPRSISLELKYSTSQGNWFDSLSVDGLGDVAAEFD